MNIQRITMLFEQHLHTISTEHIQMVRVPAFLGSQMEEIWMYLTGLVSPFRMWYLLPWLQHRYSEEILNHEINHQAQKRQENATISSPRISKIYRSSFQLFSCSTKWFTPIYILWKFWLGLWAKLHERKSLPNDQSQKSKDLKKLYLKFCRSSLHFLLSPSSTTPPITTPPFPSILKWL